MKRTILIVDDEQTMAEMLDDGMTEAGYAVQTALNVDSALAKLRQSPFDVVVTDLRIGTGDGLDLCRRALEVQPDLPVIVMTAYGTLDAAVGAIRVGAYDFVNKPIDLRALQLVIQRALRHLDLTRELKRLRESTGRTSKALLIGDSERMRKANELIARLADTDTNILVTGESGTGKELAAQTLHNLSSRAQRPFVAINCAALPPSLLESELFGHKKGSFTGANKDRAGLFEQANGGTLFLDEIGEMPLEMQVKLLRALQERKVRPVGGDRDIEFDARIVSATNRDLEEEIEEGRFREDLFYRINVVQVKLPPLRVRGSDPLLLAQRFVLEISERLGKKVTGISEAAAEKLLAYDWPGNVRELRNAIERAVALARFDQITPEDLPERVHEHEPTNFAIFGVGADELPSLSALEDRYIRHVMTQVDGNKSRAAEVLGLGRSTLYRRLERLEAQ